jgi:hypothetical protein
MNIAATRNANRIPPRNMSGRTDQNGEPASESRALVAVNPTAAEREPVAGFRQAPFLAQLIATRDQIAQTRERRRAEPAEAIAAYRATEALIKH